MFDKLAMFVMLASETPMDEHKAWQTKTACESTEALDQAFLSGFYGGLNIKEASDAETYILASELGMELGVNMLYNMKRAIS